MVENYPNFTAKNMRKINNMIILETMESEAECLQCDKLHAVAHQA